MAYGSADHGSPRRPSTVNKQIYSTLMSIFFFFLVVLMPRVLFLCMVGFSAFFADIPGLGFLAFHRLPPNNSTAWAKVGPSYRPSSYKEPYAEHISEQQQVVNINGPSRFPEVNKLSHLQKEAWSGHPYVALFEFWGLPVGGLIISPVVLITSQINDVL